VDGLYAQVDKPVTKPAEAIGAWLESMENELAGEEPFQRSAELREAIIAAGQEVDAAAAAQPEAARLRDALHADALAILQPKRNENPTSFFPWLLVSLLGGVLIGVLITKK
jgi:cell division septum initiation protein DivIVA